MATKREEVETEVDRGVIAFLETITAWIIIGFFILFFFAPILKLIINGS
jgi:preprotein translocase subunit SecG